MQNYLQISLNLLCSFKNNSFKDTSTPVLKFRLSHRQKLLVINVFVVSYKKKKIADSKRHEDHYTSIMTNRLWKPIQIDFQLLFVPQWQRAASQLIQ